MQKEVIFRTDGNQEIGHGHVVRCFSLAMMIRDKFDIRFVTKELPDVWKTEISNHFPIQFIEDEYEFILKVHAENLVVLDGYHFDSFLHESIKTKEASLIVIDDLHQMSHVADLIINSSPNVKPTDYLAQSYTHYALGPDFVMLRPSFLRLAQENKKKSENQHLFICFGGSDSKNLSSLGYQIAAKKDFFKRISIVTGASFAHLDELKKLIKGDKRVSHYHAIQEEEMARVLEDCNYALVPSSGILHEVIAASVIPVSGYYIQNQQDIYLGYKKLNAIVDAGDFSPKSIDKAFDLLPKAKINTGLIDGLSGQRFQDKFVKLSLRKEISFRKVNIGDVELTYNWAKNAIIRQFAFTKHEITAEEHLAWMKAKIADKNCVYFIIKFRGLPIGSIRFDISADVAVISYLADSTLHGKGFGKSILSQGIFEFERYCKENSVFYNKIIGFVKNDNLKSLYIFNDLNFRSHNFKKFTKFTYNLPSRNTLKIGLLVSGELGYNCMRQIRSKFDTPFVFTDRSSKRIISYCNQYRIPVFIGNPRTQDKMHFLNNFSIDVLFSINYLFLIDQEMIDKPKIAALNIHGSLLPKYRGRTPHVWSIINGEKKTGITVHHIDIGCDTGDIIYQESIAITDKNTGGDLLNTYKKRYPTIVLNLLQNLKSGDLPKAIKQDETKSTYFEKRTPEDGQIDWNLSANQIVNWVRALSHPYPGAFTYYNNKKIVIDRISKIDYTPDPELKHRIGEIISTNPEIIVKSRYAYLKIDKMRNKNVNFERGNCLHQQKNS